MTVAELIDKLKDLPQDLPVLMFECGEECLTSPVATVESAWNYWGRQWPYSPPAESGIQDEEVKIVRLTGE